MNFKYIITSTLVLLATFFMVSSAIAGTADVLKKAGEIQVLGVENALSVEPYEFARDGVRFETAVDRTKLATADSNISLGDEIQELGIEKALSAEPYEFIPVGMEGEMTADSNKICTDRLSDITSYGGGLQPLGIEAALFAKC